MFDCIIYLLYYILAYIRHNWDVSLEKNANDPSGSVNVNVSLLTLLTLILRRSRTGTVWFYTSTTKREQHDQNCTQSH